MADVIVSDNPAANRFEARLEGDLAGFANYELAQDSIVFTHTEVDPAFKGKGVGGTLVRNALDAVRNHGQRAVVSKCGFLSSWVGKHPEYADLVQDASTDED